MKFYETKLRGAFVIDLEKNDDERGFFARTWDKNEMQKFGCDINLVQCNVSFNKMKGTLRGMHYQIAPYEESKLVRCTKGKIFDVILDLRPNSETFKQWVSTEIDETSHKMIYVPKCFAHGFQTLEDNTEIFYQMSEYYMPEYAKGICWDDKIFDIKWPIDPKIISEKDLKYPSFNEHKINKI